MADFPTNTDDKGASNYKPVVAPIVENTSTRKPNQKDLMNTHSAQFNIPSKRGLEPSTTIRLISGAAGLLSGNIRRDFIPDDYDWKTKGKDNKFEYAFPGRQSEQIANDPYKAEDETVKDHQNSLWFSGVRVIDSLIMSFDAFSTDKWIEAGNTTDEYPASAIIIQNILMNITQKKNIVRTQIAGSDGRLKQYLNLDDYEVSFSGKIIGYNGGDGQGGGFVPGERPEVAIRAFVNFMEAPTVVQIGQDLLELVKITRGVISDFQLTQEIGKMDNQAVSFKLLSDNPFKIIIKDV